VNRRQRENMQAFQLRLPRDTIRDLQILRVFSGLKVSEELRNIVVQYVEDNRPRIRAAADSVKREVGASPRVPGND